MKTQAYVCAYLLLKQEDKVLLQLRKNTGYCDGMWCLVSGHVEEEESATHGMIREAAEEIGVILRPEDLKVLHVMHSRTNRFNMDIFFECLQWEGEIKNLEPDKCEKLEFFPINSLPTNTAGFNGEALNAILTGKFYSEQGWK